MLPVTALLPPVTGLTEVTMSLCSCFVKRFKSRPSLSDSSQSSRAPARSNKCTSNCSSHKCDELTQNKNLNKNRLTWIRCNKKPVFLHPADISDPSLSLNPSFTGTLTGGLSGVTVDPQWPLPASAREAGGTKQQTAIWGKWQKKKRKKKNNLIMIQIKVWKKTNLDTDHLPRITAKRALNVGFFFSFYVTYFIYIISNFFR